MKYSEVLRILYGKDTKRIISLLNSGLYAPNYKEEPEKFCVVHTGFHFKIHTGTEIALLFDMDNGKLIRQGTLKINPIPVINGLLVAKEQAGGFYNVYMPLMYAGVAQHDNQKGYFATVEDVLQYMNRFDIQSIRVKQKKEEKFYEISSFKVYDPDNTEFKPIEYPFQRRFEPTLFFGHGRFELFQPDSLPDDNDEYYYIDEDDERNYSRDDDRGTLEDWLEDEFGDDADTAYWNIR